MGRPKQRGRSGGSNDFRKPSSSDRNSRDSGSNRSSYGGDSIPKFDKNVKPTRFSKGNPSSKFSKKSKPDRFSKDSRPRRRDTPSMHRVTCDKCRARCEVPFLPTEGKPVYCSDCFRKSDAPKKGDFENELKRIHQKLDKIIDALEL